MSSAASTQLQIGEFTVLAESNELVSATARNRVRPMLMQVLLRLAAEPGAAVSREQLLSEVWSRKLVNDEVLSRAVAELRTALGDDPKTPRYIETLPKVGYRLIAPVQRTLVTEEKPAVPAIAELPAAAPVAASVPRSSTALFALAALAIVLCVGLLVPRSTPPTAPAWERQLNAALPIASDPAFELSPRFSSDAKQIIYVRTTETRAELLLHATDSGARSVVLRSETQALASPVFFPDGQGIAYWRGTENDCAIVKRSLSGAREQALLDCKLRPQARFDLSPTGLQIVFAAQDKADFPSSLWLLDLGSQQVTQLSNPGPGEGGDSLPRFSPDGKRVAFFRGSSSHDRLWLLDLDAPKNAKPVSTAEGLSYGIAWVGNAGPLLVAADWHGFRALNSVDLGSGESRIVGARGARFPDFAQDGSIVFENATYRADLWLTSTAEPGSEPRLLWPSTRYTNQPAFSPDGKRVVFTSNRDGNEAIYIGQLDGEARRMQLSEGYRYIRPHWSSDGKHIVAVRIERSGSRPGEQNAVLIDADSGKGAALSHLGGAINSAYLLSNGDYLLGELVGYAMRLSRQTASGTRQRLPLPEVAEFAVYGNTLVYTLPQLTGATQCALDSMRCAPLQIALNDQNQFDWTLTGDAIWYAGPNAQGERRLFRYALATAAINEFDFAPLGAGASLAVSPDGEQLIVQRALPPAIDLMLAKP